MEYVSANEAVQHITEQCIVTEYPMQNTAINLAVAEILGRYPKVGYAVNHKCTEMAYVLKGSGKLVTEERVVHLSVGDAVAIPPGEIYFWEGNMKIILPCAPSWHPEQYQVLIGD